MTLAAGHPILAIPGPSPVPDRVLRAAHRPSPDIYGDDLAAVNHDLIARLKWVAGTDAHVAPYIGNGHAGWEAAAANLFSRGDAVLVLVSGYFGTLWAAHLAGMGLAVETMDCAGTALDPARLADRLARDDGSIRAVMVCQTDTATGVRSDVTAIRAAMGDHPALLVVDAIAALGCAPMQMDAWGVDVVIAASQKGLMSPPGTAFVWFSDRAAQAGAGAGLRTPYWDWGARAQAQALWQFWGGTPPVQQIFALREALTMIAEETLPTRWARHEALARATWAAFDAWGQGNPAIALAVADAGARAPSVTAAHVPGAEALRAYTATQMGVTLGIGIGADPATALRVAHMGHCNAAMLLATLGAMQTAMAALGIAHGPGAIEAACAALARHGLSSL